MSGVSDFPGACRVYFSSSVIPFPLQAFGSLMPSRNATVATMSVISVFSQLDPFMDSINRIQGIYFLCTDGQMDMTSRSGTEFEFHGILDSTEIVNEKYLIGNDQCHVIMFSGQTEIVITL